MLRLGPVLVGCTWLHASRFISLVGSRNFGSMARLTLLGGDVTLDIFVMGRTIAQSSEAFRRLLFRFFSGQRRRPVLTWPCRMVRCLLGRGLYDAVQVESFFREYFGSSRRLFGPGGSRTKVAVTTTTNSAVILTNYRAAIRRPDDLG